MRGNRWGREGAQASAAHNLRCFGALAHRAEMGKQEADRSRAEEAAASHERARATEREKLRQEMWAQEKQRRDWEQKRNEEVGHSQLFGLAVARNESPFLPPSTGAAPAHPGGGASSRAAATGGGRRPSPYRAPTETQALAPALGENSAFDEKVASRMAQKHALRVTLWQQMGGEGEVAARGGPVVRCCRGRALEQGVPAFALSERPPMRVHSDRARAQRRTLPGGRAPADGSFEQAVESEMDRMMTEFRAQLREESRGEAQPPVRGNSNAPARPPQYPPRAGRQRRSTTARLREISALNRARLLFAG